jgi:segregation and condensation protein B
MLQTSPHQNNLLPYVRGSHNYKIVGFLQFHKALILSSSIIMEITNNNFNEEEFLSPDQSGTDTVPDNSLRPDFLAMTRPEQISAIEVLLFASEEPLSAQALYAILVPIEESDKKTSSRSTKNGVVLNGTHAHHEEFIGDTPQIAYLQAEPPEGITDEAPATNEENTTKPSNAELLISSLIDDLNAELETTGRVFRVIEVAREGAKGYQFATNAEHGELLARLVKAKSKKRLSKAGLETLAIIAYRQPVSKPELEVIRGVSSHEIMNRLLEKNLITIVGRSESVGKPLLYGTTDEFLRLFGLHSIADLPKPRELEELMAERADILEVAQILAPSEAMTDITTEITISQQSDASGLL